MQNAGENKYTGDSVVQVRMQLLVFDFNSSSRGERHNSYYANHPQRAAHLVMFKISVGRDLQNSNYILNGRELNSLCPNGREHIYLPPWQKFNYLPAWSNVNLQHLKSSNSQPISSRHEIIHTPAHLLSGVYYDNGECHILCARA